MQRREFLGALSVSGTLLVGGCTGDDGETTQRPSTARGTPTTTQQQPTTTERETTLFQSPADTSFTEVKSARATAVEFYPSKGVFTVTGSIRTHCTVEPVLASTRFDADSGLATVVAGTDPPKPPATVSCNYSPVYDYEFVFDGDSLPDTVAVRYRNTRNPADGVASPIVVTRPNPRSPLPEETTIKRSHYPEDGLRETDIRYDDEADTVTIRGGVRGGCNTEPTFEVAGYDQETQTLQVVVSMPDSGLPETPEQGTPHMVDCSRFPTFNYELTLAFADRLPNRVAVEYQSVGHPDASDTISAYNPNMTGSWNTDV